MPSPVSLFIFFTPSTLVNIRSDWKRWTQLNSKRCLNTCQTVVCGIPSSLLALRVDLHGLCSKLSWIRLTFSSDTCGWPELLPLHRQPICSNWWFQQQMVFLGGWMLKRRWNVRCTSVAESVLMNSRMQKILYCIIAILLSTDAAAQLCIGECSSGDIWKFRTSSFKCYVNRSHTLYSSGNIDVWNWVHPFESRCIMPPVGTLFHPVCVFIWSPSLL